MIAAVVGLALAYAALVALLANLNLRTRLPRTVKAGAIVAVTGLYVVAWQAHQGLLGWATPESLPDRFRLHWVTVDEPDKASGGAGRDLLLGAETRRGGSRRRRAPGVSHPLGRSDRRGSRGSPCAPPGRRAAERVPQPPGPCPAGRGRDRGRGLRERLRLRGQRRPAPLRVQPRSAAGFAPEGDARGRVERRSIHGVVDYHPRRE